MIKKLFVLLCLFIIIQASAQERIQMRLDNGVYTIPCTINGLRLRFIFDTGATDVLISATEAAFMLKNEYLSSDDFQNFEDVILADGTVVENAVIILREVKIGSKTLKNVKAYVSKNIDAPLLLGQSVIGLLGRWYIDNDALVLGASPTTMPENIDDAVKQFEIKGDVASAYNLLKDAIVQGNYRTYEKWILFIIKNDKLLNTAKVNVDDDLYAQLLFEAVMADYTPLVEVFKKTPGFMFWNARPKRQYYYEALFKKGYHIVGKYLAQIGHFNKSIFFDEYVYYLESSAKLGDVESYNLLGTVYNPSSFFLNLTDRKTDITKALYWYKKAADRNDSEGQYYYATTLLGRENVSSEQKLVAINYLKKAANNGYTDAISELVTEYYYGGNIKRNLDSALFWAKKLENDKSYKWWAHAYIGFIYFDKGETQLAASYLEKATKVKQEARNSWTEIPSHTYAQLGEMYYWGKGVTINNDKALQLFLTEIEESNSEDIAYCYGYVGEIYDNNNDYTKAFPYFKYAAEHDYANSQAQMAKYYILGYTPEGRNDKKAEQWAQKAINNQNASNYVKGYSYRTLGNIYSYDDSRLYDIHKAVANYEKASSYNDSYASFFLGEIYENGKGEVHKNFKLAEKYYRLAAEQGYEKAKEKLKLFQ